MRHRRKGRTLGRSPSHQRALKRNLVVSLLLTEREDFEDVDNEPKVKGRIITTLQKAKEVRPLVERCITIARRSLNAQREADVHATQAERHSEEWKDWRKSERYRQWSAAIAPVVAARRRVLSILNSAGRRDGEGHKEAVRILFGRIAPRFEDKAGGYTRILRLAKPRLGDAGTRAILEFVGVRDRVTRRAEAPRFESPAPSEPPSESSG